MSEMVERVARVLCARYCYYGQKPDDIGTDSGMNKVPFWTFWAEDARAAIAAMRIPTSAMEAAGGAFLDQHEYECGIHPLSVWDPMIDAALAESPVADPGC